LNGKDRYRPGEIEAVSAPTGKLWRVCRNGQWHALETPGDMAFEDNVFVNFYPRIVDIQWHVNYAATPAVHAVADRLLYDESLQQNLVALGYHYGAPNNEIYDTPKQAARRLLEIAGFAETTPFVGTIRKRLKLAHAFDGERDTVDMVDTWMRLGGELRPSESETLRRLIPKVMIFRHVANDDSFIFAHVGDEALSSKVMGDGWSHRVIGRPADDCYSDPEYESNVCADYSPVMSRDEGHFHHLRAVIDVPGRGPGWYNYERLTLPWVTPSGERVLMVLATASQRLDIPFLSGDR